MKLSIKKWKGALFALGMGIGIATSLPGSAHAAETKLMQTVETTLQPDSVALPRRADYGYTEEDVDKAVDRLLSYETDPIRRDIQRQLYRNSVWYSPENQYVDNNGKSYLLIYEGAATNRKQLSYELLSGLAFFPNARVILNTRDKRILAGVELNRPFTEGEAYRNYQSLVRLLGLVDEVKAETAGKSARDKAQWICDYVAGRLNYDFTIQQNSLQDVVGSRKTACVGYNGFTELLFRSAGLSYVSMIATNKENGIMHIFGTSKLDGRWLIFDTSNYDNENGVYDKSYIFSELEHEQLNYRDFNLLQSERLN